MIPLNTILATFLLVTTTIADTTVKDRQYLLVGVSGGLQDGFTGRPKLNYNHGLEDESKAIYVGRGLVKGYKAFLDVMQSGWREYTLEPDQPIINSNVFASGCAEHANEYWVYLVDLRQVMSVLNNEPRFLSITPDTGQIDLLAEETTPAVKSLFSRLIEQQGKTNKNSVALPLVTAVWFQYESHVPSPVLYVKEDGTEVTNFPESLAKWAGVDDQGRAAMIGMNCADETCPADAREAYQAYLDGIRAAVRKAESNRPTEEEAATYRPPFQCKEKIRFGVDNDTARINTSFTAEEALEVFKKSGYTLDFDAGIMLEMVTS
ncbi:hypothetical protein MHU86_13471 [Fragilaria crotonensis]|nr:hypothetical protein MHU86_13471 [Fragilaria crotonensis]